MTNTNSNDNNNKKIDFNENLNNKNAKNRLNNKFDMQSVEEKSENGFDSTNDTYTLSHDISITSFSNDNDMKEADHFIKCIFFCKFHAVAGPQIAVQVPDNYISKDVFDTISQYVIPKAHFQRSFVSL